MISPHCTGHLTIVRGVQCGEEISLNTIVHTREPRAPEKKRLVIYVLGSITEYRYRNSSVEMTVFDPWPLSKMEVHSTIYDSNIEFMDN